MDQDTGGFYVAVLEKVGDIAENHVISPEVAQSSEFPDVSAASGEFTDGTVSKTKQTRWQQRGNHGAEEGTLETGAEGLVAFSSHPHLGKQWSMLR
jgi:hypothetical protein